MSAYQYRTTMTIGDTNLLGGVYFLNFFKLQGVCRELFVKDRVSGGLEVISQGINLITKSAQCHFNRSIHLYETVLVELTAFEIKRASAKIRIRISNEETGELKGEGEQHIVFADQEGKLIAVPAPFRQAFLAHSDESEGVAT